MFELLTSWKWWVSVVFVGILINLASAYIKPTLDTRLGRLSHRRRARSEKARKLVELSSAAAREKPEFMQAILVLEFRCRSEILYNMIAASLFFIMTVTMGMVQAAFHLSWALILVPIGGVICLSCMIRGWRASNELSRLDDITSGRLKEILSTVEGLASEPQSKGEDGGALAG
jgi:ABC-type transport system involved in cytochrome bd biosynthesis fused ATPase/permease subunit